MKSKEDIFKSNVDCNCRACEYDALKAMDEYAKQVAIDYLSWFWFESDFELYKSDAVKDMGDGKPEIKLTHSELFELYKKEKQ